MMKSILQKSILLILTFFILIGTHEKSNAQQDTTILWNIETIDGNEYTGVIVLQTEKELKLKTNSIGTISLKLSDIVNMSQVEIEDIRNDGIWFENPQEGRYFFSPSSYGLKKGQGYYQNTWVFFNQVSYGVTDNFSIGIGTVPLFLFGGTSTPVWITPKFSIPIEKDEFAIGGGALIGTVIGEDSRYGVAYGTATFGDRNKNGTFGIGYGIVDDQFANRPTISFSGMIRTGKKGYLITENYFLSTGDSNLGLLSLGGRRIWGSVSLDFGGIIPVSGDIDSIVIIPWLSISISFGEEQ